MAPRPASAAPSHAAAAAKARLAREAAAAAAPANLAVVDEVAAAVAAEEGPENPVALRKQHPGWTRAKDGVALSFLGDGGFKSVYQRNNKSGGLKNLRCFPTCADFHRQRGFCGRSVSVRVDVSPQARASGPHAAAPTGGISCWGQFVPALREKADFDPSVGEIVSADDIESRQRTKSNMRQPLIAASPAVGPAGVFEVNRNPKGWHYGWTASKHLCDTAHHFKVYVFQHLRDSKLECIGVLCSSSFVMFCRRRRRFALQPSAPIAPVLGAAIFSAPKPPSAKKKTAGRLGKARPATSAPIRRINAASAANKVIVRNASTCAAAPLTAATCKSSGWTEHKRCCGHEHKHCCGHEHKHSCGHEASCGAQHVDILAHDAVVPAPSCAETNDSFLDCEFDGFALNTPSALRHEPADDLPFWEDDALADACAWSLDQPLFDDHDLLGVSTA